MIAPLAAPFAGMLLLVVCIPVSATAADGPARCTARKVQAATRAMAARYRFQIGAAGGNVLPDLLTTAGLRLMAAVNRADALGPCPGTPEALFERINCVPAAAFPDASCTTALLSAARAKAIGLLRCHEEAARRRDVPASACVAHGERRFAAAIVGIAATCCDGCDLSNIGSIVDFCIGEIAIALSCGNGVVDPGEQCDGQRFCTSPGCRIQFDPRCCVFPQTPVHLCTATPQALELCGQFGGTLADGYCPDEPCPGDPFPGCQVGSCTDPSISPTRVCCQATDGCGDATATTALALRTLMLDCVNEGSRNVLGTCGPDGRQCVAE